MDEFFQKLREIQKRERSLSSLSSVGDDFYSEVSNYFNRLMKKIDTNPFSFDSYLLRDAQRITEEIFERREHKIASTAVMNVQRMHHLFKEVNNKGVNNRGPIKREGSIKVPVNSTPEEEKLYLEVVEALVKYRKDITSSLKTYTHKNYENRNELHREPLKTVPKIIDDEETSPPFDEQNRGSTEKNPVKMGFEDFTGLEDQIHEIYGSETLKEGSGSAVESNETDVKEDSDHGNDNTRHKNMFSEDSSTSVSKQKIRDSGVLNEQGRGYSNTPPRRDTAVGSVEKGFNDKTETLIMFDKFPSIVCVDENVYGPVAPQDIVTMPEPNARIIIKNKKGRSIQTYK